MHRFRDGRQRAFPAFCLLSLFYGLTIFGSETARAATDSVADGRPAGGYLAETGDTARIDDAAPADAITADTITADTVTADAPRAEKAKFNIARIFSNTAGSKNDPNYKPRKVAFVLGPGFSYAPQTSVGFVIGGQLYFDAMDKRLTDSTLPKADLQRVSSRRSNLLLGVKATVKSQFALELTPEFYFLNRRLMLKGFIFTGYWPRQFYGVGAAAETATSSARLDQVTNTVDLRLAYDVANGLFFGVGLRYYLHYILPNNHLPDSFVVPGPDLAIGVDPLLSMIYDTRDNNTRPHKGSLINLQTLYNAPIGSHSDHYGKFVMDIRHYFHIPQPQHHIDHVFALNLVAQATLGKNIPFQEQPHMGDPAYARGIVQDRFIDRHMMAFQAEYRFYWKWLGFAIFSCAGDVGPTVEDAWHFHKITYGGGVRVKPFRSLPFTIRADVGVYKKKPQFYVGINELF